MSGTRIITMICLYCNYCKTPADDSKFEIISSKASFTYQLFIATCSKCDNWQLWPTKALTYECPELFSTTDNSRNCLNLANKHCRQLLHLVKLFETFPKKTHRKPHISLRKRSENFLKNLQLRILLENCFT